MCVLVAYFQFQKPIANGVVKAEQNLVSVRKDI